VSEREARRLTLATAVAGLIVSIIGGALDATNWTTPVAVGLLMCAAANEVRARGRARRELRARQASDARAEGEPRPPDDDPGEQLP
jgi:hypothetical protein